MERVKHRGFFSSVIRIDQPATIAAQNLTLTTPRGFSVTSNSNIRKTLSILCAVLALGACSTIPHVTKVMDLPESADTPYENVLVVTLYSSFDERRYLDQEVVKRLSESGVQAVASTTMMDSRTPVTRQTFLKMVEETGADAVLVTELINLATKEKMVDMSPEITYNIRPTYYYNVFSVEMEEYVEPQAAEFEFSLVMGTALYSVLSKDVVWAIESKTKIKPNAGELGDYSFYIDEANAIVTQMLRDGVVAK